MVMIRHIVMWKFKEGTEEQKKEFLAKLQALYGVIPQIKAQQVNEDLDVNSLCAAFCAAVSDTLVPRAVAALKQTGYTKLAIAGGVAANSRIRRDLLNAADALGAHVYMPPLSLCGDNAAMIGAQAYYEYLAGNLADMTLNAYATKSILGEAL